PSPLVQRVLTGQLREQVAELPASRTQEAAVARDPHQHLGNAQRDDLGVAQPPASISGPLGQQVVSGAVDTDQEQVEVGVHRGFQVVDASAAPTSTCAPWSLATTLVRDRG